MQNYQDVTAGRIAHQITQPSFLVYHVLTNRLFEVFPRIENNGGSVCRQFLNQLFGDESVFDTLKTARQYESYKSPLRILQNDENTILLYIVQQPMPNNIAEKYISVEPAWLSGVMQQQMFFQETIKFVDGRRHVRIQDLSIFQILPNGLYNINFEDTDFKVKWMGNNLKINGNCVDLAVNPDNRIAKLKHLLYQIDPRNCPGYKTKGYGKFLLRLVDKFNQSMNMKACVLQDGSYHTAELEKNLSTTLFLVRGYSFYNGNNYLFQFSDSLEDNLNQTNELLEAVFNIYENPRTNELVLKNSKRAKIAPKQQLRITPEMDTAILCFATQKTFQNHEDFENENSDNSRANINIIWSMHNGNLSANSNLLQPSDYPIIAVYDAPCVEKVKFTDYIRERKTINVNLSVSDEYFLIDDQVASFDSSSSEDSKKEFFYELEAQFPGANLYESFEFDTKNNENVELDANVNAAVLEYISLNRNITPRKLIQQLFQSYTGESARWKILEKKIYHVYLQFLSDLNIPTEMIKYYDRNVELRVIPNYPPRFVFSQ